MSGGNGQIRTAGLPLRRRPLYPTELRPHSHQDTPPVLQIAELKPIYTVPTRSVSNFEFIRVDSSESLGIPMKRSILFAGSLAVFLLGFAGAATAQLPASAFAYQQPPIRVRQVSVENKREVRIRDIRFTSIKGEPTAAYIVEPRTPCTPRTGDCAGILFVHWYEPKARNSNRSEFLPDAVELARHGAVSLLVQTMWSRPDWFAGRTPANDYDASIAEVKNLRRALDVLLKQPGVDPARTAYVGHDFGMMYGGILAGIDHRIHAYAFLAGSGCLSDWYLLGRKLNPAQQKKVEDQLKPLCPSAYIGQAGAPVLLQFGRSDAYVPVKKAEALAAAAPLPKTVLFYDGGHSLNEQARMDRLEWLETRLSLRPLQE
jgi:predicted esterase